MREERDECRRPGETPLVVPCARVRQKDAVDERCWCVEDMLGREQTRTATLYRGIVTSRLDKALYRPPAIPTRRKGALHAEM